MSVTVSSSYIPIGAPRRPSPENAYFFVMNSILYGRMEAGYPSNEESYDEDVNVYLAHLLLSVLAPGSSAAPPSSPPEADASLAEEASRAGSVREKYRLYRASADGTLVALGIFRNRRGKRPDSIPHLALPEAACRGRGKAYYALARGYALQLYRKNTAVSDVLGKLSDRFERYLEVLSHVAGEHFNIVRRMTDGEIFHLEESGRAVVERGSLSGLYDRFLDLYSTYLRDRTPAAKDALVAAAAEMRRLDPSFSFDIDARPRIGSL